MSRRTRRILLSVGSTVLALAIAEVGLRIATPSGATPYYGAYFEDKERRESDFGKAAAAGGIVAFPELPRSRPSFAPGFEFYICYRHSKAPWLDARGCVHNKMNELGIRDREGITWEKKPGEKRIVCLGDSFTFGWGVPVEKVWTRLIENDIKQYGKWTSINCGVADGLYIDEYWAAFRARYHKLQPDIVVVSICLNDLAFIPNTLAWHRESTRISMLGMDLRKSVLIDRLARAYDAANITNIDPSRDYGKELLALDSSKPEVRALFAAVNQAPDAVWQAQAPQAALRELRTWCAQNRVELRVVLWPLFQGLDIGSTYPFATLHRVVAEFCHAENIALLDLLPTFSGRDPRSFWVDPSDEHPNEHANALAAPAVARFLVETGAVKREQR